MFRESARIERKREFVSTPEYMVTDCTYAQDCRFATIWIISCVVISAITIMAVAL